MLSRFLKSTLLLLLAFGFGAYSTTVDLHHVKYIKHESKRPTVTSVSKKGSNSIIDQLLNQNSAARITTQNYKPAHFVKLVMVFNHHVCASLYCLKYISASGVSGFSRFRKLILFPFHAFW